jgi:protein-disulfide isomerase
VKTLLGRLVGSILLIVLAVPVVRAQSGDELKALQSEMEALKQRQLAVEKELQELRTVLRRMTSPARDADNVVIDLAGHPSKGATDAALTLVEFSDFECPFCGRYFRETMPEIERAYIRTGKVRYVFRNFPLEAIHHEAFKAAEAAMCAGEQDKFWAMHDHLFTHQDALAATDLPGHAAAVGLDLPRFERCLAGGTYAEDIRRDLAEGQKAGVRGTPSFFLGIAGSDGRSVKAAKMLGGAFPYAAFKEVIEELLAARRN